MPPPYSYLPPREEDAAFPPGMREVTKEEREIMQIDTPRFMCGVCNALFVAWSFGAIPAYFWIVYLVEACVLFPLRWQYMVRASPLNVTYYWLDLCPLLNLTLSALCAMLLAWTVTGEEGGMDEDWVYQILGAMWGLACGPVLLATVLAGNAMVFHDSNQVAGCLIHIFPALAMYTLRWEGEAVQAAWPKYFQAARLDELDSRSVYFPAAALYLCWLVPYTLWLLVFGMKLPTHGYDTVFHREMRGRAGDLAAKALKQSAEERHVRIESNDFTHKEAALYMAGHSILTLATILAALACFKSHIFHSVLCLLMVILTVYNARPAKRTT